MCLRSTQTRSITPQLPVTTVTGNDKLVKFYDSQSEEEIHRGQYAKAFEINREKHEIAIREKRRIFIWCGIFLLSMALYLVYRLWQRRQRKVHETRRASILSNVRHRSICELAPRASEAILLNSLKDTKEDNALSSRIRCSPLHYSNFSPYGSGSSVNGNMDEMNGMDFRSSPNLTVENPKRPRVSINIPASVYADRESSFTHYNRSSIHYNRSSPDLHRIVHASTHRENSH